MGRRKIPEEEKMIRRGFSLTPEMAKAADERAGELYAGNFSCYMTALVERDIEKDAVNRHHHFTENSLLELANKFLPSRVKRIEKWCKENNIDQSDYIVDWLYSIEKSLLQPELQLT